MLRTLTVTTPATSLALLSIDELREAAGVTGSGSDARLSAMGLRVAAAIMQECNIAVGSGSQPTLWRETLTETFRMVRVDTLPLSRRHEVSISSIVEDGVTLDASDYIVDPESGLVARLSADEPLAWCATNVTVVYDAGFSTLPGDLRQAAMDALRAFWLESGRDPMVKGRETEVPGVYRERVDLWAGSLPGQGGEGAVPDIVAGQLARFRNFTVG
jgi:hypothetical protein